VKLKAIKLTQWGYGEGAGMTTLYITSMKASDLIKRIKIDRWTKTNREGYQRLPELSRIGSEKRKGSLIYYLMEEMGSFPTSILVNIRGEKGNINFKPEDKITDHIVIGELEIPDEEPFWLIDGQHRVEGLKHALRTPRLTEYMKRKKLPSLKEYPVIVSILNLKSRLDEMLFFYIVNERQRGVKADLAYKLLQKMAYQDKRLWVRKMLTKAEIRKAIATEIVDILDGDPRSPFYGKIKYWGEEDEGKLVKDFTLARYIADILKEKIFSAMPDRKIAELLMEYWKAIKEIYPNAFERKNDYLIFGATTGVAVFSKIFPAVYGMCRGAPSKDEFKRILSLLLNRTETEEIDSDFRGPLDEEFWHRAHAPAILHATQEGTFNHIADQLIKKIRIQLK